MDIFVLDNALEFHAIMWLILIGGLEGIVKEELIPGIEAARIELHGSAEKPYIILILSKFMTSRKGPDQVWERTDRS